VHASISRLLIAPALPRFLYQHPGLRIQIDEFHAGGGGLPRDADAVVCIGSVANSTLVAQRLGTIGTVTCAELGFIERYGLPATPADLLPTHCIGLLDPDTNAPREWVFTSGGMRCCLSPAAPLAFSDADAAVAAAVRGGGYVRVLSIEAEQKIASGLLQPVLEDWNGGSRPVSIAYARDRRPGDVVVAFSAFVGGLFPKVQTH
jgi:LysR family transcriptional regulator, regulator for bpeEF and oprC